MADPLQPLTLLSPPTGEHFHEHESETFRVQSGVLTIWIAGKRGDYGAGMEVTIPSGAPHRFMNFEKVPAVVEVSLDGPRMENSFIPVAMLSRDKGLNGKLNMNLMGQFLAQIGGFRASIPNSAVAGAVMFGMARAAGWIGYKPLEAAPGWDKAPAPARA